jgi:hypothetical protein
MPRHRPPDQPQIDQRIGLSLRAVRKVRPGVRDPPARSQSSTGSGASVRVRAHPHFSPPSDSTAGIAAFWRRPSLRVRRLHRSRPNGEEECAGTGTCGVEPRNGAVWPKERPDPRRVEMKVVMRIRAEMLTLRPASVAPLGRLSKLARPAQADGVAGSSSENARIKMRSAARADTRVAFGIGL